MEDKGASLPPDIGSAIGMWIGLILIIVAVFLLIYNHVLSCIW